MRKAVIGFFLSIFILPTLLNAADTDALLKRVGKYGQEVSRIEISAKTVSLGNLLQQGNAIAADLHPVVEQLSNADYEYVVQNMKGFVVHRTEVIIIEMDSKFFTNLAEKIGEDQDRLYFNYIKKVKPNGYWPVYMERQTDLGGCIKYGDGTLSRLYEEGPTILQKVDKYYRAELDKTISEIGSKFTTGSCACRDAQYVTKEFQEFIKINKDAPIIDKVKNRLESIKQGSSNIRFHCVGGV